MKFPLFTLALAAAGSAVPLGPVFPDATGEQTFSEPKRIPGIFDGGMNHYGRGLTPSNDSYGTEVGAVFILEAGAIIMNWRRPIWKCPFLLPSFPLPPNLFLSFRRCHGVLLHTSMGVAQAEHARV